MSSSASRRIFRSAEAEAEEEVYVVGEALRLVVNADGPLATVSGLIDGARRHAEAARVSAETEASELVARSRGEAEAIAEAARRQGYAEGLAAGRAAAEADAAAHLATIRVAAAEGLAVRQAMVEEAMPAIARAVAMATRRIVGGAYEADPALVAEACAEAVRSAAGQQILSIRVHPGSLEQLRAGLVDVAGYLRPDEGVELGGCVIDLRNGSIDATIDARLSLMELALLSAGGAAQ